MRRVFRKYGAFFKISVNEVLKHHGKLYGRLFLYMLILLIISQLWQTIESERGNNMPFTIAQVVWYVMITEWIVMSGQRIYLLFDDDIRTGNIVCFFTRPLSYYMMRHMQGVGASAMNGLIYLGFGVGAAYLLTGYMPEDLYIFPMIVVLGLMGMLLDQIFQSICGMMSLWFQESTPFYLIYQKFLFLMGGLLFPLDIYPEWALNIALHTPFAAMLYKPAKLIYEPSVADALSIAMELSLWCVAGYITAMLVFHFGQRKLEVNGG